MKQNNNARQTISAKLHKSEESRLQTRTPHQKGKFIKADLTFPAQVK